MTASNAQNPIMEMAMIIVTMTQRNIMGTRGMRDSTVELDVEDLLV
jgi:hypothetical protein